MLSNRKNTYYPCHYVQQITFKVVYSRQICHTIFVLLILQFNQQTIDIKKPG